jgi:hypothetical protein
MEIKDYCDIHGEPICVGDEVVINTANPPIRIKGIFVSGGIDNTVLVNVNGATRTIDMCIMDTIEVVKKYKKEETKPDMVNHPPHYQSKTGIEVIDVIEAFTADLKGGEATNTGNVIKYMLRWPHKEKPLQDLKKARWYLERLIKIVEEKENAK